MARMRVRTTAAVMALAVSCSAGAPGVVRVVIKDGARRMVVSAEVAATPEQRAAGLMHRDRVPAGTGMLFLFPAPTRGGFWMKNTRVGLHILFIAGDRVVEIRSMRPCDADPCPLTIPAQDYDRALEVPLGSLGGIEVGATVEVFGPLATPR